jgi:hypothetical protein
MLAGTNEAAGAANGAAVKTEEAAEAAIEAENEAKRGTAGVEGNERPAEELETAESPPFLGGGRRGTGGRGESRWKKEISRG